MGSVQPGFSWELVAASIIWHPPQPGVTFVLQDGWLCAVWTPLTPSHRWASRRSYKRHNFPHAHCGKEKKKHGGSIRCWCSVILLFYTFIKFKLCVRYWNTYTVKTHLRGKNPVLGILSLLGPQLRSSRLSRRMKNATSPPAKVLIWFSLRSPLFHLLLISMHHLKWLNVVAVRLA